MPLTNCTGFAGQRSPHQRVCGLCSLAICKGLNRCQRHKQTFFVCELLVRRIPE